MSGVDNRSQNLTALGPLMQHFRDELVAIEEPSLYYLPLFEWGKEGKREDGKETSSTTASGSAAAIRSGIVEPLYTRHVIPTTIDERLHELQCLFLRRTIPSVGEKWRKRRVSSSNSPESVFIMQCCWVPSTAPVLDTSSTSSGVSGGGVPPTSSEHRRPISSSSLSAVALSSAKSPGGGMNSSHLSHLLCGLSDGTLCLMNVLNFSKSYLIEGYGMREQSPTKDNKEGYNSSSSSNHNSYHHHHHNHRSPTPLHRRERESSVEEGKAEIILRAITALDCAPLPARVLQARPLPPATTVPAPSSARPPRTATAKRLSALEIDANTNAPSSASTDSSKSVVMLCVVREDDGVYVRSIDDIFDRSSHKNVFPGMTKDSSTSTTRTTSSSSTSSSTGAMTSPTPFSFHSSNTSRTSTFKRLLELPPADRRILYTTPNATITLDSPRGDLIPESSHHSDTIGLDFTPKRFERNRNISTGMTKPLEREERGAGKSSNSSSTTTTREEDNTSFHYPFSMRKTYTVASFTDCREYILVAVPPSGSTGDSSFRYIRERYAIGILKYKSGVGAGGSSSSTSRGVTPSSHISLSSTFHSMTSGIHASGSTSSTTSVPPCNGDAGYEVVMPWCPLPFPMRYSSETRAPISSRFSPWQEMSTTTRMELDSRSSYPTPILIQWWDSLPWFTKGSAENGMGERKMAPTSGGGASTSRSNREREDEGWVGVIPCPCILVVWSSGDVQLLQPWRTVVRADSLPPGVVEHLKTNETVPRRRSTTAASSNNNQPTTLLPSSSSSISSREYCCFTLKLVAKTRLLSRGVRDVYKEEESGWWARGRHSEKVLVHPGEKMVTAACGWRPLPPSSPTLPSTTTSTSVPLSRSVSPGGGGAAAAAAPFPVLRENTGSGVLAVVFGDRVVEVVSLQLRVRESSPPLNPSSFSTLVSPTVPSGMKRSREEKVEGGAAAAPLLPSPLPLPFLSFSVGLSGVIGESTEVGELLTFPLSRSYCTQDIPITDIQLVSCASSSPSSSPSRTILPSPLRHGIPDTSSRQLSSSSAATLSLSSSPPLVLLTVVLRSGVLVILELPHMREVTRCVVGHLVDRARLQQVMESSPGFPEDSAGSSITTSDSRSSDTQNHNNNNNNSNNNTSSTSSGGFGMNGRRVAATGGKAKEDNGRIGGSSGGPGQDEVGSSSSSSTACSPVPSFSSFSPFGGFLSHGSRFSSGLLGKEEVGKENGGGKERQFLWEWPPKMRAVIVSGGSGSIEKPTLNMCLVDHDTVGIPERLP